MRSISVSPFLASPSRSAPLSSSPFRFSIAVVASCVVRALSFHKAAPPLSPGSGAYRTRWQPRPPCYALRFVSWVVNISLRIVGLNDTVDSLNRYGVKRDRDWNLCCGYWETEFHLGGY